MNYRGPSISHSLIDLPNITVELAESLRRCGVMSSELLAEWGSEKCWLRLRATGGRQGALLLLALEGAITGVLWRMLPYGRRMELMRIAGNQQDETRSDNGFIT